MVLNRKIDLLEGRRAKVFCNDGNIYEGKGNIPCIGTDKNGEDADGVLFTTASGKDIIFIEDDIEKIEILD